MRAIRLLPYAPMWPGFAINTLFYAGTLWLLFAAPFALRRRRRIKRGLCPKCAYPIGRGGTSDVCTECGAAVPLSHRERGSGVRADTTSLVVVHALTPALSQRERECVSPFDTTYAL
jgi:hypothetical protein